MLTLIDLNGHGRLVVLSGREHLGVLGRNRRVALDHRRHHAAQRFNAEREGRHVKQQHVAAFTSENRALNCCADSDSFVGVHVLAGLLAEEFTNDLLNARHAGLTANQNHVGDVGLVGLRVAQRLHNRFDRALNEIFNKAFELRAGDVQIEVLRTGGIRRDVRQIDFRLLAA